MDQTKSDLTVARPGVVVLPAVRASRCCSFLLLQLRDAKLGGVVFTAHTTDGKIGRTSYLMVAKLLTFVASQRFRGERLCGERAPHSQMNPLGRISPEGNDEFP